MPVNKNYLKVVLIELDSITKPVYIDGGEGSAIANPVIAVMSKFAVIKEPSVNPKIKNITTTISIGLFFSIVIIKLELYLNFCILL